MMIAITGASGFIGGAALQSLSAAGHECITLGRRPVGNYEHRPFYLGAAPASGTFDDVDSLLHCAWDLSVTTLTSIYQRNVAGSTDLLRAAATEGVHRAVFISSMSAYRGTRQHYGRSKLAIEELVRELGGLSLRLGLVWGGAEAGGMAGAVQRLTTLPVVPVLGGAHSYQYTVHSADVGAAIRIAVDDGALTGVVGVAEPTRVPVPALLAGLATEGGVERTGAFVSVPWQPVYGAMRAAEVLRVPLPLRADSVLGLGRPAPDVPRVDTWPARGLVLRRFPVTRDPHSQTRTALQRDAT